MSAGEATAHVHGAVAGRPGEPGHWAARALLPGEHPHLAHGVRHRRHRDARVLRDACAVGHSIVLSLISRHR